MTKFKQWENSGSPWCLSVSQHCFSALSWDISNIWWWLMNGHCVQSLLLELGTKCWATGFCVFLKFPVKWVGSEGPPWNVKVWGILGTFSKRCWTCLWGPGNCSVWTDISAKTRDMTDLATSTMTEAGCTAVFLLDTGSLHSKGYMKTPQVWPKHGACPEHGASLGSLTAQHGIHMVLPLPVSSAWVSGKL